MDARRVLHWGVQIKQDVFVWSPSPHSPYRRRELEWRSRDSDSTGSENLTTGLFVVLPKTKSGAKVSSVCGSQTSRIKLLSFRFMISF
ncbi:hypothetical protein BC826DRAFT_48307 [Russula brevipes]|nr:hypothetical protein BC826DRAFT_48307 [Russula brevipes]